MRSSTFLATVASLTTAANGLFFDLDPFTASDIGQSHNIQFDICDPQAEQEQGGSATAHCNFSWNGTAVPACWSQCDAAGYYFKVTPGTYGSAANFSIDVWQAFISEIGAHNYATIPISTNSNGTAYTCIAYNSTKVCNLVGYTPFSQPLQTGYDGADPQGAPICT